MISHDYDHAPMAREPMDTRTIHKAQEGDAAAFESIYRLHSRHIYSLCLRMIRNQAEAEDLTQDVFLRVFRKIQTFRGESAFSTWLHRLAINVVLMHLRKKRLPAAQLEETTRTKEESVAAGSDAGRPDVLLAGMIDRVNLKRAVEQLPPAHKIVFVLHDVQGYGHQEIAEIMNTSVGASKGQLHRARRRLRDLLRELVDSFPPISRRNDLSRA